MRLLRNSHIVPEFLHRPIYDQKHRLHLFKHGARSAAAPLQKGLREYLLCAECEGRLQKHELYFSGVWYKRPVVPSRLEEAEVVLEGLNYKALKLFLLSIVWRASVSSLPEFHGVHLGPHEETLRQMIVNSDAGPEGKYPIGAGLIVDPDSRGLWDNVMLAPLRVRIADQWAYRLVFAAASWTVAISNHKPMPYPDHWLTSSGRLRLTCIPWPDFARESGLAEAVQDVEV